MCTGSPPSSKTFRIPSDYPTGPATFLAFAHEAAGVARSAGLEAFGVDYSCVCGVCGWVEEIDHVDADARQGVQREICGIGHTDKRIIGAGQEKQSRGEDVVGG